MNCQRCQSERIADMGGKVSDMCFYSVGNNQQNGYVPGDMGVGGGDYLEFKYCLDCGQLQGNFPLPPTNIEKQIRPEEVVEFFENHLTEGWEVDSHLGPARRPLIESANELSPKFGNWLKEVFQVNSRKYPPRRWCSAEHFKAMFEEGITNLNEQW
jgi:hypothetical protein